MLVKFEHLIGDLVSQGEIFTVGVVFQLTNPNGINCTDVPDSSAVSDVFPPYCRFCQNLGLDRLFQGN